MKIVIFFVLIVCACAAEVKESQKASEPVINKDKRQTQGEVVPAHLVYRTARKQEQVAPVEESQDDDKMPINRSGAVDYRPGQVYSLNAHELLELQPERKAPLSSSQQLQQLYSDPQPEHKQNLQQFYYLEPQAGRQVALQPSHAVIARPHFSSNGGEASVGAALSVSDTGASSTDSFDQDLLALLGQAGARQEEREQTYQQPQTQQSSQSVATQYQQVDRYLTKPSKKPTKLRSKVQIAPPQSPVAPQQYLIETTNVQQQELQRQQQYRQPQQQRPAQALRYVPIQSAQTPQQVYYERPEPQGIKVVAPPKLQQQQQQPRSQLNYRLVPQYQQQEAAPKQYRIVEAVRPQPVRQEQQRVTASSVERPVTYLKRFPEPENIRAVKYYEQPIPEPLPPAKQPAQIIGEQYYLRPLYRGNEQRARYELPQLPAMEQSRILDSQKHAPPPHSAIYVSKNVVPKKVARPQQVVRIDQTKSEQPREQTVRIEQPTRVEQVNIEQHGQNLEDQRSHLPPPRNNKAYTPEEFAALVAAGYAVTPVPVAQSRSSEVQPQASQRRPLYSRRQQYLPLRGDDAP